MTGEDQLKTYEQEMGYAASFRQKNWAALTDCPHCWAAPGQEHVSICPRAEPEEPQPPQTEALF